MSDDARGPVTAPPVTSDQLLSLLHEQHDELRWTLGRVHAFHGSAREDVFLQARRLLAIHETLERVLAVTSGHVRRPGSSVAEEIEAAEVMDHESAAFERALARVADAHDQHTLHQEPGLETFVRALDDDARTRVATAMRMWQGEGDAYLGNSYAEMLTTAEEQLANPDPQAVRRPG